MLNPENTNQKMAPEPTANGQVLVGWVPGEGNVYASLELISQHGFDRVREELVDRAWFNQGITPPGYYKVRTHPFNDDYVLVKAHSQEAAIQNYLNRKNR